MRENGAKKKVLSIVKIPETLSGKRIDQAAALLFPQYSRTRLQLWIKAGQLTVDGKTLLPKDEIVTGQIIKIDAVMEAQGIWQAQDLGKINIVYEDRDIIVVDKPAGLVVHPAAGNRDRTLINALLFHAPELSMVPRAGIIHRLDKDTSGLIVVARNLTSHNKLVKALKDRTIEREYEAIVSGVMTGGGSIEAPIGRHPTKRILMAVVATGKPAITRYRVIPLANRFSGSSTNRPEQFGFVRGQQSREPKCEGCIARYRAHTHIQIKLETGRTHQIRVHMAYIGYPIVGDKTYSGRLAIARGVSERLRIKLITFKRQALHARQLRFIHPKTKKLVTFISPLPQDMRDLLTALKDDLQI